MSYQRVASPLQLFWNDTKKLSYNKKMSSEIEGMGNIRYPSPLHGFRFSWFLGNSVLGFFVVKIFWMNQPPPPQTFTNDATCTCLKLHLISKNCGLRSFSLSFFLFFSRSFEKVNLYNFVLLKKNKTKRTTNLHFRRSRCHLLI